MTNDEMNIAIAEALGKTVFCGIESEKHDWPDNFEEMTGDLRGVNSYRYCKKCRAIQWRSWLLSVDKPEEGCAPDYCNDLNAMRDAEATLSQIEFANYTERLFSQLNSYSLAVSATAAQRAEAFLKTKGIL